MKNGLISDSSRGVEQCKYSKTSCTKDKVVCALPWKGPFNVTNSASSLYDQLISSSYSQMRHAANTLAFRAASRVLAFDNFVIGPGGIESSGSLLSINNEPVSSSKPQLLSPSLASPTPAAKLTPLSSVRALSSTPHNGLEKSMVTPAGQGEDKAAGSAASLNSFQHINHAEVMPMPSLHRANMPFITPIHREGEFICGWGAAFINICVTFPINKAIFRQQLHGISGLKAIRQLRKDGLQYLYRGLLPPLLQKTMSLSVMFGMYFHCQDVLKEHFPKLGVIPNHALAAMISGTLEATFMPFERIQTLMQNREFHNRFANTPDAFRHLWGYGFKEYYRGLSLIIWRNGPSNVAFFLGREYIQDISPQPDSQSKKMLRDFLSGACLGAMISTVFFPLNVVKTRMQSKLGGLHKSGWATLKVLLAERKGRLGELFKGVHLNYTRSFISWGIINVSFEVLIKLYNGESWARAS
ncbi:solute carrier family 25 member [Elysia marginata]|uniref:Solute carrier family 25 member n=1 Tax=Elysia marginata TaxID=1093978 RepID=A0AAV4JRE3_9GAST|nr:solute carrier family 25 member [Elysia marginata]